MTPGTVRRSEMYVRRRRHDLRVLLLQLPCAARGIRVRLTKHCNRPAWYTVMSLTRIEESLVLAAYFRGGSKDQQTWRSNTDQILTLSLFYTGDITGTDCAQRLSQRSYVQKLYDEAADEVEHPWGKLTEEVQGRYDILIGLLRSHPELIEGKGNFDTPALPTYTSCRLTEAGLRLAETLEEQFSKKPDFPNWPDKRTMPERK